MSGTLLDLIVSPESLRVVFQPIFVLEGPSRHVHAYECLTRGPSGTNLANASILFEYARRKRAEIAVDRACISAVFRTAREVPDSPRFNVNVHAATLARDAAFPEFLAQAAVEAGLDPARLTVEVIENAGLWDILSLRGALDALRALGVTIALDDVGLGQSNFRMMLECHPDYFKIDQYFVHGAAGDSRRRAVLASVSEIARQFGGAAVAEGVEDDADLQAVRAAGIGLAQGFGLSRAVELDDFARVEARA